MDKSPPVIPAGKELTPCGQWRELAGCALACLCSPWQLGPTSEMPNSCVLLAQPLSLIQLSRLCVGLSEVPSPSSAKFTEQGRELFRTPRTQGPPCVSDQLPAVAGPSPLGSRGHGDDPTGREWVARESGLGLGPKERGGMPLAGGGLQWAGVRLPGLEFQL